MSSNILGKRVPVAGQKAKKPEKLVKTGTAEGTPVVKRKAAPKKDDEDSEEMSQSEVESQEDSESNEEAGQKKGARGQNNLGALTKRFVELMNEEEENGGLDLKKAVEKLGVQKRRIYDITNVMEGISALKKISKSRVQWVKRNDPQEQMEDDKKKLDEDLAKLEIEEQQLDAEVLCAQKQLDELLNSEEAKKYAYVTIDDIKAWGAQATGQSENFFVISANNGSRVEVEELQNNQINNPDLPFGMKFKVPEGEPVVHLIQKAADGDQSSTS